MFMSDHDKERANGGGADEDDDEKDRSGFVRRDDRKKQRRHRFGRDLRKAKQVVLFPFRKAKKNKSSDSAAAASVSGSDKRVGCYLCFTQPQTSESSVKSETSDPNNPQYTYARLKALIEKNDFYSKECNPHIDIISSFSD